MKKKLIYLILLVCPIGILSANNTTNSWAPKINSLRWVKGIKACPEPKQENNFELGPGSWLL